MLVHETTLDTAVWEDASGVCIDYALDVVEDLRRLAVDGFNAFAHGGREIGGVLYGRREESRVTVLSYAELDCEHALGPRFVLSEKDHAAMAGLMATREGLDAVGWFRAHTRSGLELDAKDRELFERYFEKPLSIGLNLKPTRWGPVSGAFYFRSDSGEIGPDAVREFTIEPPKRELAEEIPAVAETPSEVVAPPTLALVVAEPVFVPASSLARRGAGNTVSKEVRSWALAVCAGVLIGATVTVAIESGPTHNAAAESTARIAATPNVPVTGEADRAAPVLEAASPSVQTRIPTEPIEPPVNAAIRPRPRQARIPGAAPAVSAAPSALPTPPTAALDLAAAPKVPDLALNRLLASVPGPADPPARKPAYAGPRRGRLIWTGDLARRGVIEIDGSRVSLGSVTGALPGVGLAVTVMPAEFSRGGLTVFTADMLRDGEAEPPSQSNGWNSLHFKTDPGRARELVLLEAPNSANDFKRLVVRNDGRACSVVLVDWNVE